MNRSAQPEEIAPAYVSLAAPHCSNYTTGEVLPIKQFAGEDPYSNALTPHERKKAPASTGAFCFGVRGQLQRQCSR
jgi:hypothetical protein